MISHVQFANFVSLPNVVDGTGAKMAGAPVTLSIYPRMWHVWPMYCEGCAAKDAVLCEAEDAIAEIGEWCNAQAVTTSGERARV